MDLAKFIMLVISAVFINNFILSKFLGLCSFIGVSKQTRPAVSMGIAVTFVTTMASIISWLVYRYALLPFNLGYLRTISFILVIASFVQFVEIFVKKTSPALFKALGIYLPLITVNCAVLGVAVLNSEMFFENNQALPGSFAMSIVQGFAAGIGYMLAMFLMSGIRERLDLIDLPHALKGVPITFIIASLMSLAFLGFAGFRI